MRLIERRIGFLFAVFLALLAIGFLKASWLGAVKAGSLKRAAATQQKTDVVVPARRGAIMDREGTELAVSQPAVTIAATPYLVKDAAATATKLAPLLGKPEDELIKQLARRDTGFVYLARRIPTAKALARAEAGHRGPRADPRVQAALPARLDGVAAARRHRHRQPGAVGARVLARQVPARPRRRAQDDQGRTRRRDPHARDQADRPRQQRQAHARQRDPGPRRAGARRGRRGAQAQGRDGDRHGSARRLDPRARELAAGRTPTLPATRPTTRARTARSARPTSRARRSRRSPSPARSSRARSRPTPRSTCRRRSRSPTARSASRTRSATAR